MSNIRTLADLNNNNNDPEARPFVRKQAGSTAANANDSNPRGGASAFQSFGQKTARDESFCDALRVNLCPKLELKSALFVISVIQIIIYIIELSYGGLGQSSFLAATPDTLEKFGQKDAYKMRYDFQLWRFFCPMFLHLNFTHISCNVLAQLMIGSGLESDIGSLKFTALYLLSGFGGILFSALCSEQPSVGASTAVYGLVGSYLAFLILNWTYLKTHTDRRFQILVFLFISLILAILLSTAKVDVLGHLGGFIAGTLLSLALLPSLGQSSTEQEYGKKVKKVGLWSSIGLAIFFLVLFYTVREPAKTITIDEKAMTKELKKMVKQESTAAEIASADSSDPESPQD